MSTELFVTLSNDFKRLLENTDDYNVSIRVGEMPKVQTFKAHSVVLRTRSTYFRNALSSEWAIIEDNTYIFTKPNITPESFETILNGTVSWKNFDGEKTLELLVAADELCLSELLEYVQDYFITKGNDWLLENINEYCHTIFQHENFHKLQESCIKMVSNDPQKFQDFSRLALKLKDCIQFIRFYHISGADFYNHVRPYEALLPKDLYENLLRYQFKMDKPPISTDIIPPRGIALDSKLIGSRHAALIASWIDHQKNFDPLTCHLVPPLKSFVKERAQE
ncbi:7641_t:CDS:2 [Funneliformis geosporum]|nr:7641_t:CDS:2 [Funneliformis geosporum]